MISVYTIWKKNSNFEYIIMTGVKIFIWNWNEYEYIHFLMNIFWILFKTVLIHEKPENDKNSPEPEKLKAIVSVSKQ